MNGIGDLESLISVIIRENMRALSMFDRSDNLDYIMHHGASPATELHLDEGKALRIMYNMDKINWNGDDSWTDMNWYDSE